MPHHVISRHWRLCAITALCSVMLSLWAWHADPIINNDGTQYITAASRFLDGQWERGFEVYRWPFYSVVSAVVAKATGMSAGRGAYAVNAALYILLIWGFLACLWRLGAGRRVLAIGAIVALLHPTLNEYRSYVIRDIGYWTFYLWSLAYFFQYILEGQRRALLGWSICALLATLFRVEGLVFLLLLPALAGAGRWTGIGRRVSLGIGVALSISLLGSAVMWQSVLESGGALPDIGDAPMDHLIAAWHDVWRGVEAKLHALGREFPGQLPVHLAWPVYVATLTWLVIDKTVRAGSVVYMAVAAWTLSAGRPFPRLGLTRYWWAIIAIHLVYLCEFAFISFFLTDRYPIALGLTLLACVPFGVDRLLKRWRDSPPGQRIGWVFPVVVACIIASGAEGMAISTDKYYLREAGLWLRENMEPEARLYSNEKRVIYYANKDSAFRPGAEYSWQEVLREVWSGRWRQYDYLALSISDGEPERAQYVQFKLKHRPVRVFDNEEGDRLLVFRIRATS